MSVEHVLTGWEAIEEALPEYVEAEKFYCGNVEEFFSSKKIEDLVAQTGQPYRFNFAQKPVTALLGRVELRGLTVPGDEDATDVIKDVYDANDMDAGYPDVFLTAFEYGDAYELVLPYDRDGDGKTDDLPGVGDDELTKVGVESILLAPKECRLMYDPDNDRRKLFFIRRWDITPKDKDAKGSEQYRVELVYPDVIEKWETNEGADPSKAESWQLVDEEPHEHGEIPVFHYRTAKPYGVPVHRNAYAPQLAINKMLITQLTTSDAAGWPQRYLLTDDGAVLDQQADSPDWAADENATAAAGGYAPGEGRAGVGSNVRGGPGTLQVYTGTKEVGQFDAADTSLHFMQPAMQYIRIMAVLTDTPLHDLEQTIIPPSGESRRVAEQPLVNKARDMQRRFRSTISERWRFTLRLAGVEVRQIDVRWRPPYSADDTHDWQVVQLKQQSGVPTDQTLLEVGYEGEQVARWLDSTTEAMSLPQRAALVVSIADAGQKLAALVSASAMKPEQANSLIGLMLGKAMQENENPA